MVERRDKLPPRLRFHGNFAKKADAEAKAEDVPRSHVIPRYLSSGRFYSVAVPEAVQPEPKG